MEHVIIKVESGSIGEELGIAPGDILLEISGEKIRDVFDYRYLIHEEYLELLVEKANGEHIIYEIEKEEAEDLGVVFETGLLDKAKNCANKCIFCFIDQLPKHMRKSLYFKDDDSRLSFLQGNYVTLTNISPDDFERIIFYHLSPINISVHTTNPELREFMLKNPRAKDVKPYLDKLFKAGIEMNFQIVLCKGVNDNVNLDETIEDLGKYLPLGKSLAVVPVGLTKYRDGLSSLENFSNDDALKVINQIKNWQDKFKKDHDSSFVYASDEFYLKAGVVTPNFKEYEGFPQIENGVGMLTLFEHEFMSAFKELKGDSVKREVSIVTSVSAWPFIKKLSACLKEKYTQTIVKVWVVENNFFGNDITVTGLLTGKDIISQLEGRDLGKVLLIPENALRFGEEIFLDDMTLEQIRKKLNLEIRIAKIDGSDFIRNIVMVN